MGRNELERIEGVMGYLQGQTPAQMKGFQGMMGAIEHDGKVSAKTKEAVALGIAVKAQCPSCIAFHVKQALAKGYTKEEILEIAWVAVLMGGGPSLAYMSYVQEALEGNQDE
ncbi:MAG: carboxymuconolactone decarboxylase family protein [Candidatus Woesearchaeota archaeon]